MQSHFLGSKKHILKNLNIKLLPGFTSKINIKVNIVLKNYFSNIILYKNLYMYNLQFNKKLKYYYNFNKKNLFHYLVNNKVLDLYKKLELRLDNILFRSGLMSSIIMARQYIKFNHIFINKIQVSTANFFCKVNDIIRFKLIKNIKYTLLKTLITYKYKFNLYKNSFFKICLKTYKLKIINNITPRVFLFNY